MRSEPDYDRFYVLYDQCKILKDLGYSEPCCSFWELEKGIESKFIPKLYVGQPLSYSYQLHPLRCSAPTFDEVFDWLRRVHNIFIYILPRFDGIDGAQYGCNYSIFKRGAKEAMDINGDGTYSFIEAKQESLKEVLETLKT